MSSSSEEPGGDPREELRALLFGEGTHERDTAPEPELVAGLAPALSPPELRRALQVLAQLGAVPAPVQLRCLAALAERCFAGARDVHESFNPVEVARHPELVARLFSEPAGLEAVASTLGRHPELARHLSLDSLVVLTPAVRALEGGGRLDALLALAAGLPPAEREELLLLEVRGLDAARRVDAEELLRLVGNLTGPLSARAALVLDQVAAQLDAPSERAAVLADLFPALEPADQRMARTRMEHALAEADEKQRAGVLVRVAPCLEDDPEPRQREALQLVDALADSGGRIELLVELALGATGPLRGEALALALARRPGDPSWPEPPERVASALADLARRPRPPAITGLPQGIDVGSFRPWDLLAVASVLTPSEQVAALEREDLADEEALSLLDALLPSLDEAARASALPHSDAIGWDDLRAQWLRLLAETATPRAELRAAAERIPNAWWRARTLASLLAPADRSPEVEDCSDERAHSLLAGLTGAEREPIVDELLDRLLDRHGGAKAAAAPAGFGFEESQPTAAAEEWTAMEAASQEETAAEEATGAEGPEESTAAEAEGAREPAGTPAAEAAEEPSEPFPMPVGSAGGSGEPVAAPAPGWRRLLNRAFGSEAESGGYAKEAARGPPPSSVRLVNTGFASRRQPAEPLDSALSLRGGRTYLFWIEVGELQAGAIDVAPTSLQVEKLPPEASLAVVLYGFPEELEVEPGADVGWLRIAPDGNVHVERPVPGAIDPERHAELAQRRLFFLVKTPARDGSFRLRCNIYHEQVLVQSHLVEARVRAAVGLGRLMTRLLERREARRHGGTARALKTTCDYKLSRSLRSTHLRSLEPHRLSLFLNDDGEGTHGFRVFGADGSELIKEDASISGERLKTLIDQARGALRQAAWGSKEPWDKQAYRYENGPDRDRFRRDLVDLAKWGYRFYTAIVGELVGRGLAPAEKRQRVRRLQELMRTPGRVQMASREAAGNVVPVAFFYDHDIDDTAAPDAYTLCPRFEAAIDAGEDLAEVPCFLGDCPSRGEDLVLCPSGFWGFRHRIGLPNSALGSSPDACIESRVRGKPQVVAALSTDPSLVRRDEHLERVRTLRPGLRWTHADTRKKTLIALNRVNPHVVYFYCHGGITTDQVPYIQVGPLDEKGITRAYLFRFDVFFEESRPLIFINGCHTTALSPEVSLDLVGAFLNANAAGVIGTEITVFEPLACTFGEVCLRAFLGGTSLGESVRLGRLALLSELNPLGLVYIPFAVSSLRLV